jgi:hypothetical protein
LFCSHTVLLAQQFAFKQFDPLAHLPVFHAFPLNQTLQFLAGDTNVGIVLLGGDELLQQIGELRFGVFDVLGE